MNITFSFSIQRTVFLPLLLFLCLDLSLIANKSVYGQVRPKIIGPTLLVTPARLVTYSVTPTSGYLITWSLRGNGGVIISGASQPNVVIDFDGQGSDTLIVRLVDPNTRVVGFDTLFIYRNTCKAIAGNIKTRSFICLNERARLAMDSLIGQAIYWEHAPTVNGPWSPITDGSGADSIVYTSNSLTTNQYYRAIVLNENCVDTSRVVEVQVTLPSAGSFDTELPDVCAGNATIPLGATITSGKGRWATNGQGRFTSDSDPNARYISSTKDLSLVRLYWIVKSDGCDEVQFEKGLNVVLPPVGAFDTQPRRICPGSVSDPLRAIILPGNVGTWSHNGKGTISNISDPNATYASTNDEGGDTITLTWSVRRTGCDSVNHYSQRLHIIQNTNTAKITTPSTNDTVICRGANLKLSAARVRGRYFWSSSQTILDPGLPDCEVRPTSTADYYLTVFDFETGCSSTDTVRVKLAGGDGANAIPLTLCLGEADTIRVENAEDGVFEWTPVLGLDNPKSSKPLASPQRTTIYSYRARFPGGCFATGTARVNVLPRNSAQIAINDTTVDLTKVLCKGYPYFFTHQKNSDCDIIYWFKGDTNEVIQNVIFDSQNGRLINGNGLAFDSTTLYNPQVQGLKIETQTLGTYYYTTTCFKNATKCIGYDQVKVDVLDVPNSDFVADFTDVPFKSRTINFAHKAKGAFNYFWSFGDTASGQDNFSTLPNPSHRFSRAGVFTVSLIVDNGACSDPEIKTNYIRVRGEEFYFPSAFSPNGDGINDRFRPIPIYWDGTEAGIVEELKDIKEFTLEIYNSWGDRVLTTQDPQGWNGNSNDGKELDAGTYTYKAIILQDRAETGKRENVTYKGTITLIR